MIKTILLFLASAVLLNGCSPDFIKAVNSGYRKAGAEDYDGALQDFNLAIKLNDKYAVAYSYRGRIYFQQGNYQKAIEDVNQSIFLAPKNAAYIANRGEIKKALGDTIGALSDFRQALENSKYYNVPYVNRELGKLLIQIDSCEEGTQYLKKAIKRNAFNECDTKEVLLSLINKCENK